MGYHYGKCHSVTDTVRDSCIGECLMSCAHRAYNIISLHVLIAETHFPVSGQLLFISKCIQCSHASWISLGRRYSYSDPGFIHQWRAIDPNTGNECSLEQKCNWLGSNRWQLTYMRKAISRMDKQSWHRKWGGIKLKHRLHELELMNSMFGDISSSTDFQVCLLLSKHQPVAAIDHRVTWHANKSVYNRFFFWFDWDSKLQFVKQGNQPSPK